MRLNLCFAFTLVFILGACLPIGNQGRISRRTTCTDNTQCTTNGYVCLDAGFCGMCDDNHTCSDSTKQCVNNVCKTSEVTCSPSCEGNTPFCLDGSCVECSDQSGQECDTGKFCNASNECENEPDCTTPSPCGANTPYCYNNQCVECSMFSNQICSPGYTCNTGTNSCYRQVGASCPTASINTFDCKYSTGTSATCKCGILESTQNRWVIPIGNTCSNNASNSGCESGSTCTAGVCTSSSTVLDAPCSSPSTSNCVYYSNQTTSYPCKCGNNQSNTPNRWVIPYNSSCYDDTIERCEYGNACNTNTTPNKCTSSAPTDCDVSSMSRVYDNNSTNFNINFTPSQRFYTIYVNTGNTTSQSFYFDLIKPINSSFIFKVLINGLWSDVSTDTCVSALYHYYGCSAVATFGINLKVPVAQLPTGGCTFKVILKKNGTGSECKNGGTQCSNDNAYTFNIL